jgi:hypothetical protein
VLHFLISHQEDDMKKAFIGIAMISLASFLFAQPQSITSLQEEILGLAKQRHELIGKNLELRGRMLDIMKGQKGAPGPVTNDAKEKMSPLRADLRQNQQQIRSLSKSIHEKRKILANLIRTKKMHGKDRKAEAGEDITSVD